MSAPGSASGKQQQGDHAVQGQRCSLSPHSSRHFPPTLGRSVFGSLSTFSIAVRVSKPPTTLREKDNFQLSQHHWNIPTLSHPISSLPTHSTRFLYQLCLVEGQSATVFGRLKITSFRVEGKNFFSSNLGFEFKHNKEKSNIQRECKNISPQCGSLLVHRNQPDGEGATVGSCLCKKKQIQCKTGSFASFTSINLYLICYYYEL